MDFIQRDAIEDSQETLDFSDDETINDKDGNFIDDSEQLMEDVSFYRKLDPENLNHYNKFPNWTWDLRIAVYEDDKIFFGTEDTQPEFYDSKNRKTVEFDKFEGFEKSVHKFKNWLKNFNNSYNPFFDSVAYGVMFRKYEGKVLETNKANNVLRRNYMMSCLK